MNYLQRLLDAQKFYSLRGYQAVTLPWLCSETASVLTGGPHQLEKLSSGQFLLGSAEQAFIDAKLVGRYQAITPCFRLADEGKSAYHLPYFMKLELWSSTAADWEQIMSDARAFFDQFAAVKVVGGDLELNGIEVGSYGNRFNYAYGTGLAEPRFTSALTGDPQKVTP